MNLLTLMLVSGMEELKPRDISYMKNVLFLEKSDEEATLAFKGEIMKARNTQKWRMFNNWIHIIAHYPKCAKTPPPGSTIK